MECKVAEIVKLPSNDMFIGKIIAAYSEEQYINGRPDIKKISPFTLTMTDNNYWLVG